MSNKKSYSEKLKDPRWQKKRLKIMERDDFKCTCCGESMEPLNVHHVYYLPNKEPWEYVDSALTTFCEQCHKFEHQLQTLARVGIVF